MSPGEQAAAVRALADAVCDELARRAAGEAPDRRFDPFLAIFADLSDELAAWHREATSG